jgi:hypothetical protein
MLLFLIKAAKLFTIHSETLIIRGFQLFLFMKRSFSIIRKSVPIGVPFKKQSVVYS